MEPPASAIMVPVSGEELRGAARDEAVRSFYEAAGWRACWSAAAERELLETLDRRARHGLDRIDFGARPSSSDSALERELKLTRLALAYASALAYGAVDPSSLHEIYTLPRPAEDVPGELAQAMAEGRAGLWFASLAPDTEEYRHFSTAYLDYSAKAREEARDQLPDGGVIHVGDHDSRIVAIAAQLADNGYLTSEDRLVTERATTGGRAIYTASMKSAVERLQGDYGIAADGVIGPDTFSVLNLRAPDRARALAVAMERRRWMPRSKPATRIDVNIAAARLQYIRDDVVVDERRVVAGRPDRPTPLLSSPIFRLVANPTWTVPKSIQNTELAQVDAAYLQRNNMVLRAGWIVQGAGPGNALGQVKFDMRNGQAIYLHDTSAPALFDRSERHLSHGCVRVEDALGFAQMLASDEGILEQWLTAREVGQEQFVALPREIPVRLLYRSVLVRPSGDIAFRADPYGWSEAVARHLGFTGNGRKSQPAAIDLGP
ncbi:peptidoglycan-binding protein [Sphingobium chungbukense]|uniref:Peptidoglycan-binding protein n=2 Tax=Sphingobium chungbukense TaxID=56193 RepID=A0A0M3ALH8_9SPHN|nr:peptidoglycan-binding protein [Sphingobium chungbukense]